MSSTQTNPASQNIPPSNPSNNTHSRSRSEKGDAVASNPAGTEHPSTASEKCLDATNDVREIIRLVQCEVCSRVLEEPTTLPCGHSLCKQCVPQTHVRTNISYPATANRRHGFKCPFEDCKKEHAVQDCALDVTLNKALAIFKSTIETDRNRVDLSKFLTQITVHDKWEVAGVPSLTKKVSGPSLLKGGRIVATYTLVELGRLDYGCEVSYASFGVGEDEVEQIDTAVLNRIKESTRTEMDCQVCYALFLDPLTTTCGHTFCRSCLHRILDHSDLCPLCRRPMSVQAQVNRQSYPSNQRLCKTINAFWADLVALRSQAYRLEQQANNGGYDIALFVCTLAFPRMPTFLHVFEPRYRLMIRRAMEGDRTFGMVLPSRTREPGAPNFMELGTLLRIVNIEFFPDGRSLLETVGVSRFRVTRHGWLDGYVVGNIEKINDISVAEEESMEASETMRARRERHISVEGTQNYTRNPHAGSRPGPLVLEDLETLSTRELVDMGVVFVRRMRQQSVAWLTARVLAIYGECPTDPAIFPWWLASILPIKDEEKHKMLGTSSVRERLKLCCRWIVEWESSRWLV